MNKRILIVGSGGREHALAWKSAASPQVEKVFVAPGNGGTALENKVENIPIDILDFAGLAKFAKDNNISLTIIGPEVPLAEGIVDYFAEQNLLCFGPKKQAASIEASKEFCKAFLQRHHIPTAAYSVFSDVAAAEQYLQQQKFPVVIKADGLAAGKGVVIAADLITAKQTLQNFIVDKSLGKAGHKIIIEEFLTGEELSYMVITDGKNFLPLTPCQDHKALLDGDKGPNTGGMGAYSPTPLLTPVLEEKIIEDIIKPTIKGLAQENRTFVGFLYAGLMISPTGEPKVLEFNCRLGDPETQVIMMRLASDFIELCEHGINQTLAQVNIHWHPDPAITVVLAAPGYPNAYEKNLMINGITTLTESKYQKVFHAGTKLEQGKIYSTGGRVLNVTAMAKNLATARDHAYTMIEKIHFDGMQYRKDIGVRGLKN